MSWLDELFEGAKELAEKVTNDYGVQTEKMKEFFDERKAFAESYRDPKYIKEKDGGGTSEEDDSGGGGDGEMGGTDPASYLNRDLRNKSGLTKDQVAKWIEARAPKGSVMHGKAEAYMNAEKESGLDVKYLIAHSALETGWGTSNIVKTKGNWYGIGAFDATPYESAYKYDSVEAGIVAGAVWILENYTKKGQETIKKMRHNNGVHQYATDPQWDVKIATSMSQGPVGKNESAGGGGTAGKGGGSGDGGTKLTDKQTEKVMKVAQSYVGKVVYSQAGTRNPDTGRTDCSGFVNHCFMQGAGKSPGTTTGTMINNVVRIGSDKVKKGDLVFFKNTYSSGNVDGVSHVGICKNATEFIDCNTTHKGGIGWSKMDAYWNKHFLCYARMK